MTETNDSSRAAEDGYVIATRNAVFTPSRARGKTVSAAAKANVMLHLATRVHDGSGLVWPSQDLLAVDTGLSRGSVGRTLDALKADGLIEDAVRSGGEPALRIVLDAVRALPRSTDVLRAQRASEAEAMRAQRASTARSARIDCARRAHRLRAERAGSRKEVAMEEAIEGASAEQRAEQPSLLPSLLPVSVPPPAEPDAFEAFWAAYPRKVGKIGARKAWGAAIRKAPAAVLIAAATAFAADPNREPEFTCHPTTWLNQGRWEDDPLPNRSSRTTKVGQSIQNLAQNGPTHITDLLNAADAPQPPIDAPSRLTTRSPARADVAPDAPRSPSPGLPGQRLGGSTPEHAQGRTGPGTETR